MSYFHRMFQLLAPRIDESNWRFGSWGTPSRTFDPLSLPVLTLFHRSFSPVHKFEKCPSTTKILSASSGSVLPQNLPQILDSFPKMCLNLPTSFWVSFSPFPKVYIDPFPKYVSDLTKPRWKKFVPQILALFQQKKNLNSPNHLKNTPFPDMITLPEFRSNVRKRVF